MKSINSSFFGRFFGHATKIILDTHHLTLTVNHSVTKIKWQDLISPPVFSAGMLGQRVIFCTLNKNYVLTKMEFNQGKKLQYYAESLWVDANKQQLEKLLTQIKKVIQHQYLRQSKVLSINAVVQKEYSRWFPWAEKHAFLSNISSLVKLLLYYQNWQKTEIEECRENYISQQLSLFKSFFDTVESHPLTLKQRRACVIDDDNNLLLAGAGTGKTSVMIGRTGYLLKSQQAVHSEILLLAYGRRAADEMDTRIIEKLGTDKISATTFHSLGLTIITHVEGKKPKISAFSNSETKKNKWIQTCFKELSCNNGPYRRLILEYFSQYYYVQKNDFEFDSLGDYYQYLTDNDIRSLKGERVTSFAELYIANWLFNHGIEYQYKVNYAFDVQTIERRQYQPDFFLPEFNVYIEYYAVDEDENPAPYINKQRYNALRYWKQQTHCRHKTECIELTYAQHKRGRLLNILSEYLTDKQIEFKLSPDDVRLETLNETGHLTLLAEMFAKLVGLYKAACLDEKLEKNIILNSVDITQIDKAFELLKPLLNAYQKKLLSVAEIDFEDMISKALMYIVTGQFRSPWRYIMVDEFQDISEPRARLVKALRDSFTGSSIFSVGDDWQAIYRFSGADVALTTNFDRYFGLTTQMELDRTFRFNNKIGQVALAFISKNPSQINKTIIANRSVNTPAVSILCNVSLKSSKQSGKINDAIVPSAIHDILTAIQKRASKYTSVYLLARFWFYLPDKETLLRLNYQYPMLNIQSNSFHAAKGKEADQVIILGMKAGKHGFPSRKVTPAILDALLPKEDLFEYAEERRLFYVALTRAKHRVYIVADMQNVSSFVTELIDGDEYDVELNEFNVVSVQKSSDEMHCLICQTGVLKKATSRYGVFYYCSNFPLCTHKERDCVKC